MKTSTVENYPPAPAGTALGRSQPHATGGRYLRWGLAQRRNPPGSTSTGGCCLCTAPAGAVGGPTESSARLMSAPARPPGSSSACPRPRRHSPCCLWSKNRCTLRAAASKTLFKRQLVFTSLRNLLDLQCLGINTNVSAPFLVAR